MEYRLNPPLVYTGPFGITFVMVFFVAWFAIVGGSSYLGPTVNCSKKRALPCPHLCPLPNRNLCNGLAYSSARCLRSQGSVYMGGFVVVGGVRSKRGGGFSQLSSF